MTDQTPPTDRPLTAGDWIEWHGGENPVPGQMVVCCYEDGSTDDHPWPSEEVAWGAELDGTTHLSSYRLVRPATSAASEGALAALICAILEDEGGSGAPWSVIADRIAASIIDENHLAVSSWTVRAALEKIAGEQQYRSGYCQTDITVEPALSADEAQSLARETLAALASPPVSERERELEGALAPFAEIGQWFFARDLPDETPVVEITGLSGRTFLTRGMFKAAHSALTPQPAGEGK